MDGFLDFPFHLDGRGRTATTGTDDHIRDMITQVLFTDPGERVNRPDFGCGLKSLLFMPNSETLVKGSLQLWLQNEIRVEAVEVRAEDSRLEVAVAYSVLETGERRVDVFTREI